jgi:serine O-acetyltransferase
MRRRGELRRLVSSSRAFADRLDRGRHDPRQAFKQAALADRRATFPSFREALVADARVACRRRGHGISGPRGAALQAWRLVLTDASFLALAFYRLKAAAQRRGLPVVPRVAHRLAMLVSGVCIGDPVWVAPGVLIPRGAVVIDGVVEVHAGVEIGDSVTIGLQAGNPRGPVVERDVTIGAGAKILGPVTLGIGSVVGPNTVVVVDVPAHATCTGVPGRVHA